MAGSNRLCPVCRKDLVAEKRGRITIDVCAEHGIWLDQEELPAILAAFRRKLKLNRMVGEKRARREGALSGSILGIWSLLG